jgi:pheromone shutdown protein TraB
VHLLGTAPVSTEAAELVGLLVKSTKLNAVFVELDLKRVQKVLPIAKSQQLGEPADPPSSSPSTLNPIASIQQRAMDSSANVVGNALRSLYKKLENEGIDAGQEFAAAIREGLAQGATIVLGDQDVDVTLRRLTRALTRTNWSKLLSADESVMNELLPAASRKIFTEDLSNFSPDQFRSTVELVKTRENVRKIMAVLQDAAPEIYMAMVGERDAYMADGLNRLEPFNTIVAVVGLAHVDGIERYLSSYGWVQIPKPVICRL